METKNILRFDRPLKGGKGKATYEVKDFKVVGDVEIGGTKSYPTFTLTVKAASKNITGFIPKWRQ